MNEPTVEQIATIAAELYSGGMRGVKTAVYTAIKIWDQATLQLEERKQPKEEQQNE